MAIEDIIPLNLLLEKSAESESQQGSYPQKKKKKVDKEALASSFMRIPKMNVTVARDLIDIGIREQFELKGRAPEAIFEEIRKIKPHTPEWTLPFIRMAVYFCEEDNPEPEKLNPEVWKD